MSVGVESLGWPRAWPRNPAAVWVLRATFGLLLAVEIVVLVAVPIMFNSFGEIGTGLLLVMPLILLVPTLVMQLYLLRTRFRSLPRVLRSEGGNSSGALYLPDVSERVGFVSVVFIALGMVAYVIVQTIQFAGKPDVFAFMRVMLVLEWALVGALVVGVAVLGRNLRTVRPGIEISSQGLRRRTLWSEHSIAWDQVSQVDPERGVRFATWLFGTGRFQARRVGLFPSGPRETSWAEPLIAAKYRIDPPLLLAILRFYHRHPELRGELESGAARERIRNIDFPGMDLGNDGGIPRLDAMVAASYGPGRP